MFFSFKRLVVLALFGVISLFFVGCYKTTDTYSNSKFFKQNSSKPVELLSTQTVENLAQSVLPAVVAIESTKGSLVSIGSGVCLKSGGYIVTNHHVVAGATNITLYTHNSVSSSAVTLWSDEVADIAILKSEKALPYLQSANNQNTLVGQDVLAVGTPLSLNFTHTFTKGIVSAKNRTIGVTLNSGQAYMQNLIQHDASLNPGNSGGPLLNLNGEVVGINTLKISTAEGLGFAIPIDAVMSVLNGVYENYNYSTPFLGVFGYDASLQATVQNNQVKGFYVKSVAPNSPAEKLGLQVGDVILNLNNHPIITALDLKTVLYSLKPNQSVTVGYERNGTLLVSVVNLISHPNHKKVTHAVLQ